MSKEKTKQELKEEIAFLKGRIAELEKQARGSEPMPYTPQPVTPIRI